MPSGAEAATAAAASSSDMPATSTTSPMRRSSRDIEPISGSVVSRIQISSQIPSAASLIAIVPNERG